MFEITKQYWFSIKSPCRISNGTKKPSVPISLAIKRGRRWYELVLFLLTFTETGNMSSITGGIPTLKNMKVSWDDDIPN